MAPRISPFIYLQFITLGKAARFLPVDQMGGLFTDLFEPETVVSILSGNEFIFETYTDEILSSSSMYNCARIVPHVEF